jgi:hypothetical protein
MEWISNILETFAGYVIKDLDGGDSDSFSNSGNPFHLDIYG